MEKAKEVGAKFLKRKLGKIVTVIAVTTLVGYLGISEETAIELVDALIAVFTE